MRSYSTRQEVADKIEWEGGLSDALEYGITVNDLPEGDTELRSAWQQMEAAYLAFDYWQKKIEMLLPEVCDEAESV